MGASAGAIKAGQAYVELMLKNNLARGLSAAGATLNAWGASISGLGLKFMALGGAITAPLLGAVKVFADTGHEAEIMAKRTGISVEALSQLDYAAKMCGASMEDFVKGVRKMGQNIASAALGNKNAIQLLKLMGMTYDDLKGKSPDQQFLMIAEALSKIPDMGMRSALALKMFGKSGGALLPMMENGAEGVREFMAEADRFGLTMSGKDANAASKLEDGLKSLWAVIKKAVFTIGSALAPVITEVVEKIRDWGVRVAAWIAQNKGLVVSIFKGALALTGLGLALVATGKIISGFGAGVSLLGVAMKVVGAVIAALISALGMLFTPLGAIVAVLASGVAAWLWWSGNGAKAVGTVRKAFGTLVDDVSMATGGIRDALMAGDIGLAAKILWLTIKLEGMRALLFLKTLWWKFKNWCLQIWYGLRAAWLIVTNALATGLLDAVGLMKQGWLSFESFRQKAVTRFGNWMAKQWIKIKALFDDSIDVEASLKYIDDMTATEVDKIDSDTKAEKDKARQWLKDAQAAQQQQFEQDMIDVGDKAKSADDELANNIAEGEKEISDARDALKKSVDEAAKKRAEMKDAQGEAATPMPDIPTGVAQAKEEIEAKSQVRGGFGLQNLSMLGAADPVALRTAKAAEKTAKNTEDLLREWRDDEGETYGD